MAGEWDFDFEIREACPNRVRYLREAVDMLVHSYPDVDVVDIGWLGPCFYRTVFRTAVNNPEDYKEVALAVARLNEFIRGVRAQLAAYGWQVFEKEAYVKESYVYVDAVWVRKIRVNGRRHVTAMDIYELALPHIKGYGGAPPEVLEAAVLA
jgi:hypothetical protein